MPEHPPWGPDGPPTVREVVRAQPFFAAFVFLFAALVCGVVLSDHAGPATAIVLGMLIVPAVWWLLVFAAIRGWINFDD
jgi:hypothetical protein